MRRSRTADLLSAILSFFSIMLVVRRWSGDCSPFAYSTTQRGHEEET